jgi:Acetyltransferase (GNAT) domain
MPFECRPSTSADERALIELLTRVFAADSQAAFVNPALLRWKYWEPREDYTEPRSFVMEKDGRIVAHIGLWPVTVRREGKSECGVHIIDWAADPDASGSGIFLLQRMARSFDFVYAIGGSDATQAILPKLGFRAVAEAHVWARPMRPWRQFRNHQSVNWRLPARLVRNIGWAHLPGKSVDPAWTVAESNDLSSNGLGLLVAESAPAFFQYVRRCPGAQSRTFHILHNARSVGFFVLSAVWEQARVAGVWLEDSSPDTWAAVLRLAQDTAFRLTGASEIILRCGAGPATLGAEKAGLRLRARIPVFVLRKRGGAEPLQLPFHFLDNDAFFLGGPSAGFVT